MDLMKQPDEYLLGSDDVELRRLARQHQIWSAHTDALLNRAGFDNGDRVLDLGAGPGFTTLAIAERVGSSGLALAVDTSSRFAERQRRLAAKHNLPQMQFRHGDVQTLELPEDSFDGAVARWLFCFLSDPAAAIGGVARALRPGGRFAVMDYFNYMAVGFFPPKPALARPFTAVYRSFRDSGGDLDVGGKLPTALADAGFEIESLTPICETARPDAPVWQWFLDFKESFFPKLIEDNYLSGEELGAFEAALAAYSPRPDAFFFPPPMIAIVARKR